MIILFIYYVYFNMILKNVRQTCQNMRLFPDTVFNLPNHVEVLMEVNSESNIDGGSGNEQNAAGNENNNNDNTRKLIA